MALTPAEAKINNFSNRDPLDTRNTQQKQTKKKNEKRNVKIPENQVFQQPQQSKLWIKEDDN